MKQKIIFLSLIIISFSVKGQNEFDAFRYSSQSMFGTAKATSMSGALGSLGGDFSCLSYNPAGLGMYQYTEISFSPSFSLNNSTSYNNKYILLENGCHHYCTDFQIQVHMGHTLCIKV